MRPKALTTVRCTGCGLIQVYRPQRGCKRCAADLWIQKIFPDSEHPLKAPKVKEAKNGLVA